MSNRCLECGRVFDRTKPYNNHLNTCNTGIEEEEWIENGLDQFSLDMGWGLKFDEDGRPYLFNAEDEQYNEEFNKTSPELVYNHDTGVWELVE